MGRPTLSSVTDEMRRTDAPPGGWSGGAPHRERAPGDAKPHAELGLECGVERSAGVEVEPDELPELAGRQIGIQDRGRFVADPGEAAEPDDCPARSKPERAAPPQGGPRAPPGQDPP